MLVAGGALAAMLVAGGALAAKKPLATSASSAPAWVTEAVARQVPGDAAGLDARELLDEWLVEPLEAGGLRLTHRHAHRVLRPEGLGEVARVVLPWRSEDRVERIAAWNVLPDGTMRTPHPKDDLSDFPYTAGGNALDDVRVRILDVPGIIVGSVVASETVIVKSFDPGAFEWIPGDVDATVGACRITLRVPSGWTASDHAERADALMRAESPGTIAWSAESLAPPPREEWPLPDEERLPRLWMRWRSPDGARGFADWNAVARWYRELADPVLREPGEAQAIAARLKPASDEPDARAKALRDAFAFTSREVRYISVQMGIGGFRPHSPAATCSNRWGDCKAKSFLMRSLVESWGWQAFPVLVLTSDAGRVSPEVPSPAQFNHCIVAVKLPDGVGAGAWTAKEIEGVGRVAFLDPTTESLGPWQLREDDQGTLALLVLPDGGRLVELPVQPPGESVTDLRLEASIDERGQVGRGTLTRAFHGTRAGSLRGWLAMMREEQALTVATSRLQSWVPGARLIERRVEGVESLDGPLTETITFEGGRLGQRAGDMLIVQPPALVLPIAAARLPPPPRQSRLELGLPEEIRAEVIVHAPEGWEPERLPPPATREGREYFLSVAWERTPAGFRVAGTGRQLVTSVSSDDYAAFREGARKALGAESEGVLLVRKPVTPPE